MGPAQCFCSGAGVTLVTGRRGWFEERGHGPEESCLLWIVVSVPPLQMPPLGPEWAWLHAGPTLVLGPRMWQRRPLPPCRTRTEVAVHAPYPRGLLLGWTPTLGCLFLLCASAFQVLAYVCWQRAQGGLDGGVPTQHHVPTVPRGLMSPAPAPRPPRGLCTTFLKPSQDLWPSG